MEIGSVIHHFRVTRVRELAELGARLWELEHEKTGARLVWLDRADENKTFAIGFKTIPTDDTGVFHILEHSVLGGSDKYPVKEPFVELLKSSVQTFLNAMTFPDKTVYPVSSRNDRDFRNLVEVYLDAVLHPAIYHRPEIFRQEGWRYDLSGEAPGYQGVVFNEMKGDMASPYSILFQALCAQLYPDSCYRFNSGGDPAHIPDLSYEHFLAMHRKYYHPSNARIALVGSVALDEILALIDRELAPYERQTADFPIPLETPGAGSARVVPYEIGPDEPEDERAVVAGAVLVGRYDEQKKNFAAAVLADYLAGDNEAPLKRAILSAGLGQEVELSLQDGLQQSFFFWSVWNTAADKAPAIRRAVRETIDRILAEGFDRDRLEACVNRFAFNKRDRDGRGWPRGLDEALSMMEPWNYGGDPAAALLLDETLEALSAALDTDYFAALLRELFPAETSELLLVPSKTLGEERRTLEAARAAAEAAAWTAEARAAKEAEAEALSAWQQAPDSPEALATIPMLRLADLSEKPQPLPLRVEEAAGVPVLRHALAGNIVYARLHFTASDLDVEELPALRLLAEAMGKQATEAYDAAALQTRVKQKLGKLSFSAAAIPGRDGKRARVLLSVKTAFLRENRADALALLAEILQHTRFTDPLGELIRQGALAEQMSLASRGNRYASFRAAAQASAFGRAREALSGYSFACWLKERSGDGEEALAALAAQLRGLAQKLFTRARLTLSLSENAGDAADWLSLVPDGAPSVQDEAAYAPLPKRREGILIPADVGFAVKASNVRAHGSPLGGSAAVLAGILTFEYLWSEIRVQGGAYGCGFEGTPDEAFFFSFRDPQPARSLDVYDRAAAFIRARCARESDLTRSILGSVSRLDPLRDAEQTMDAGERLFFRGETQADLDRRYAELLHTDNDALLSLCGTLDALRSDELVCVVGGQAQLDGCGDKLDEILKG